MTKIHCGCRLVWFLSIIRGTRSCHTTGYKAFNLQADQTLNFKKVAPLMGMGGQSTGVGPHARFLRATSVWEFGHIDPFRTPFRTTHNLRFYAVSDRTLLGTNGLKNLDGYL
jgi:hypothetical protein